MRRDWKAISSILDVVEQLAGHPNLKELRDEANEDLKDLLAKPPMTMIFSEAPEVESGSEPEAELKVSRRSL